MFGIKNNMLVLHFDSESKVQLINNKMFRVSIRVDMFELKIDLI